MRGDSGTSRTTADAIHILHLEDDPVDSRIVAEMLEDGGIRAKLERVDALEPFKAALSRGGHELIFSDFTIPGMDTYEALRFARQLRPETPYIFVSGTLGEEQAVEALKQGATDYVLKQRLHRLVPSVRRALDELSDRKLREQAEAAAKRKAQELEFALQRLSIAQQAGRVGVFDWDLCRNEVHWTPELEEIFGVSMTGHQYETWASLVHPEDLPRLEALFAEWLKSDRDEERWEYRFRRHGDERWIAASGRLVRDDLGRPIRMIGTNLDITERVRADEALREKEQHLRAVFENVALGIAELNPQWILINVNERLCCMLGYCKEELLGKSIQDITHPDDREKSRDLNSKLFGNNIEQFHYEKRYLKKDGTPLWVHVTVSAVRDSTERVLRAVGTVEDITERKQSEEALRMSERQYRTLAENTPEVIARFDRELRHIFLNEYGARVYGFAREQIIGKTSEELGMPRELVGVFRSRFAQIWQSGKQQTVDFEFDSPNLGHQHFSAIFVPELDVHGKVASILAITRDITKQKTVEEALRRVDEQRRLALRAAELGTWDFNVRTGDIFWDERFQAIYGAPSDRMLYQDFLSSLVHPDDRGRLHAAVERTLDPAGAAADHVIDIEYRVVWEDRSEHWVHVKGEAFFAGEGPERKAVRFIGTVADITERKRDEQALRNALADAEEGRRVLDALLEHIPLGITIASAPDVKIRYVSRFGTELLDKSSKELTGIPATAHPSAWQVFHADGKTLATADELPLTRATVQGELVAGEEWVVLRRDGQPVHILCTAAPIRDPEGRITGGVIGWQDITERKRVEEALRASEAEFRSVFEQAAIGMGRVRFGDGRWVDVNDAFCRMLGRSREEMLETPWPEITHPEDVNRDLVPFQRMAKGELDDYTVEKRLLHKSGEHVWARLTLSLVRDTQGRPDYEIAIIENISEERRAEQALRQSEQYFRQLADTMPQVVWAARPDGTVDYYNRRVSELSGARTNDDRTWSWKGLVHPDDANATLETWSTAIRTGMPYEVTHRLRRADGSWHWYLTRAEPARDEKGRIIRWFGYDTDIHAQKQAAQDAQESRSKLDAALASMTDAMFVTDIEGRFIEFNDAFAKYHRFKSRDECARTFAEFPKLFDVYLPDGTAAPVKNWAVPRALRGESAANAVYTIRRKDTGESWVGSYSFAPIRNQLGRIEGAIIVARDITDIRKAQEEQERLMQALREADQQKNSFLAMLSHELRNPLSPIKNSLYILERAPVGGQQARRAQDVIGRQVQHMTRLIDDLLDVTRISRGKIRLQKERVELCELVRRTAEDHRAVFKAAEIELRVGACAGPLFTDGDPTRLAQVIGNLLGNSVKFTPRGGWVELQLQPENAKAFIHVRDSGAGIAPDLLKKLFHPFVQADATLDRSKGGLGLGLALVKGLVEMHGGTVSARSEGPGKGAEFVIGIPIEPAEEAKPAVGRNQFEPRSRKALRVLLIEDNADAAESLKEALELNGHRVEIAATGFEGIEKARKYHPDVILCDIGLPGIDGFEVAKRMRADPELRGASLVALSGYAAPEDLERSRDAGFAKHLAKPPDLVSLETTLAEVSMAAWDALPPGDARA